MVLGRSDNGSNRLVYSDLDFTSNDDCDIESLAQSLIDVEWFVEVRFYRKGNNYLLIQLSNHGITEKWRCFLARSSAVSPRLFFSDLFTPKSRRNFTISACP